MNLYKVVFREVWKKIIVTNWLKVNYYIQLSTIIY